MFRLVRFYVLSSIIAVVVISAALIFHRQGEIQRIIALAENQNIALGRAFANTIWPSLFAFVEAASSMPKAELRSHPNITEIDKVVRTVTANLRVIKIKIYNLEGLTVYSSSVNEIGELNDNNEGYLSAARSGIPASAFAVHETPSEFSKEFLDADLIESYLPIRRGDGPVEGVFELYTDVTALMKTIKKENMQLIVTYIGVIFLLYGTLFIAAMRANRTINRQHVELSDKNAALLEEVGERKRTQTALRQSRDEMEHRVRDRTRKLEVEIAVNKQAEEELGRQRAILAHIDRISLVGEMATNLAHELNQPLTVISGCAQLSLKEIRSGSATIADLEDTLEQTYGQAERANAIIHNMKNFARKSEQERRQININNLIHEVADLLQSEARKHGTRLMLALSDNLPPALADPVQIQQIVVNLALNGMEAMSQLPTDERILTIRTDSSGGNAIEVAVQNRGDVIAQENINTMFTPFYTSKADGLGLGLSISRSLVESHGGTLGATSTPNAGTVFYFTLPPTGQGPINDA